MTWKLRNDHLYGYKLINKAPNMNKLWNFVNNSNYTIIGNGLDSLRYLEFSFYNPYEWNYPYFSYWQSWVMLSVGQSRPISKISHYLETMGRRIFIFTICFNDSPMNFTRITSLECFSKLDYCLIQHSISNVY